MQANPTALLEATKPLRHFDATMDKETANRIWLDHTARSNPIFVRFGQVVDGLRRVTAASVLGIESIEVREY